MTNYRISETRSIPRTDRSTSGIAPDTIRLTETADMSDIPPERFIASIIDEIISAPDCIEEVAV